MLKKPTYKLNRLDVKWCVLQGCYDRIQDWVRLNLNIVIGTAVGVIGLQILGIIFAFCLCKAVSSERNYHRGYKY